MRQHPSAITLATFALGGAVIAAGVIAAKPARGPNSMSVPAPVQATLSEWAIELSAATVPAGPVAITITNHGSIPHALEVEGHGLEKATPLIQPGASAELT